MIGVITLAWALLVGITGAINELSTPLCTLWQQTDVKAMLAPFISNWTPEDNELAAGGVRHRQGRGARHDSGEYRLSGLAVRFALSLPRLDQRAAAFDVAFVQPGAGGCPSPLQPVRCYWRVTSHQRLHSNDAPFIVDDLAMAIAARGLGRVRPVVGFARAGRHLVGGVMGRACDPACADRRLHCAAAGIGLGNSFSSRSVPTGPCRRSRRVPIPPWS